MNKNQSRIAKTAAIRGPQRQMCKASLLTAAENNNRDHCCLFALLTYRCYS